VRKTGSYTEPVNILNYGSILEVKTMSLFNFQLYCFDTDLKDDAGQDIMWDRNKFSYGDGVDLIRNCGLFAEYTDENISLFVETAMSSVYCTKTITDYAITWGIGIRNRIMNFLFRGKTTGTDFHSEYSSGSRTPERILEIRCSVSPLKFFETGCIVYSEKDLVPSYNKDYLEGSVQEELFVSLNTTYMHMSIDVKRKEHYSTDRNDPLDRGTYSAGFVLTERLFLKLKSSMQRFEDETSALTGCELKLLFMDYCSLSIGYARIKINGDTPFYGAITPAPIHSSVECFRESTHGASMKFRYQKEKDSFYARFGIQKTESESEAKVESAVIMVF